MRRTDAGDGRHRRAPERYRRSADRYGCSDRRQDRPNRREGRSDRRVIRPDGGVERAVDRGTTAERRGDRPAGAQPSAWGLRDGLAHPVSLTIRDGLFVHWPVDPAALRPHVPDPLELDTRDGLAWVSIVPFVLARAGLRGTPSFLRWTIPEVNVRTYVRYRDDPGLLFFSIDVGSAAVAAAVGRLTRLPVSSARIHVGGVDGQVAFASSREPADDAAAKIAVTYRPAGEVFYPEPGTLASWLTERRRFYASRGGDGVLTAEVAHPPWPLQPANVSIHENTMFAANDLPAPDGEPIAHYCDRLRMTGSIARRLSAE